MNLLSAGLTISLLTAALPAQAADRASPNSLRSLDKDDLKAFVEAPLFDPTRRPPAVLAPVANPTAIAIKTIEPPPNVHLFGIIHGAMNIALVHGQDNKIAMLSDGDRVDGWNVVVLPPNALRLSKGSRTFDYAIFAATSGSSQSQQTGAPKCTMQSC